MNRNDGDERAAAGREDPTSVRGVVFDLDGTLVDSALDFDLMRAEMGLAPGLPILEALATLPDAEAARCRDILQRHEHAGGRRAIVLPGVVDLLAALDRLQVRRAVWTRNSRSVAVATLERLGLRFDRIVAREDAPAKPNPTAIWGICDAWRLDRRNILMVGDYRFDVEAGRRAGVRTALYTAGREPHECEGFELADHYVRCFRDTSALCRTLRIAGC